MSEELDGRLALQGLVGAVVMVVGEAGLQLLIEVLAIGGRVEVDALALDRAPEPFEEGLVGGPAPAVAPDLAAGAQPRLLAGATDSW